MAAIRNLPVDGRRLWDDLMRLAEITDPGEPYTRRSFSPRFLQGRSWLAERFQDAGLTVSIDPAGNLIGRLAGSEAGAKTIVIGSHSDTVPSGGRFDGAAGVITALEIVRAMRESSFHPRHNIEVVDFLAEEPSEYGLSCVGSRGLSGKLSADMKGYTNAGGERLDEAIARVGGNAAALDGPMRDDIAAFFELHIEQGIVLEQSSMDIGIVSGIVGITRIEIVFSGSADHAGTTPMHLRRDASLAAADIISAIGREAQRLAGRGEGHFVATTGVIEVLPNAANVVPREVRLIVDARSEKRETMEEFVRFVDVSTQQVAQQARVERTRFARLSDTVPVACDERLRRMLGESAQALGFSVMPLASGAGHDAAFMAQIAPAAMIFIPCKDGKSHTPEEWAEPEAIAAGAAVIFAAVQRFDAEERI
ncbi:MAG: Zn-dependent hydrolase [Xanthobacteraceae bacterium]|nr:Zn-dependent hydrolase [Xanthobacteraceae bacterium]MCW5674544.1 Zn-dependent hydrolase [Xanthobacteraceae bacterium]